MVAVCKKGHEPQRDADGHCSECRRVRLRKQYADNLERERARGRARSKSPEVRAATKAQWAKEPTRFRMYGLKSRLKNPKKTMLPRLRLVGSGGFGICWHD
jgi:hypothetical protein